MSTVGDRAFPVAAARAYIEHLIQKTYQFINAVNGVSHSHKTANILFSFDLVA